ncbi:MAG: MlaD family protein, partial [Candidatus Dormibacteria bacterium]
MRRPLIAGLVAATFLVVVIAVALAIPRLAGTNHRVSIHFPESTAGLVAGSDVLEAGAKVGTVSSIEPLSDNQAEVVIQVADANWPLHQGVTAGIRPRGLFGEKYVDVHDGPAGAPAYDAQRPLQSTQSDVPVALDSFLNSLDTNTRAAART